MLLLFRYSMKCTYSSLLNGRPNVWFASCDRINKYVFNFAFNSCIYLVLSNKRSIMILTINLFYSLTTVSHVNL